MVYYEEGGGSDGHSRFGRSGSDVGVQPQTSKFGRSGFLDVPSLDVRGWTFEVGRSGFNPKHPNLDVRGFWTFGVQHHTSKFGRSGLSDVRSENME